MHMTIQVVVNNIFISSLIKLIDGEKWLRNNWNCSTINFAHIIWFSFHKLKIEKKILQNAWQYFQFIWLIWHKCMNYMQWMRLNEKVPFFLLLIKYKSCDRRSILLMVYIRFLFVSINYLLDVLSFFLLFLLNDRDEKNDLKSIAINMYEYNEKNTRILIQRSNCYKINNCSNFFSSHMLPI